MSTSLIIMLGPLALSPILVAGIMLTLRSVRRPGEAPDSRRTPSGSAIAIWLAIGLTTTLAWTLVVPKIASGMAGVP